MARNKALFYTLILSVILTVCMTLSLGIISSAIDSLVRLSGKYLTFSLSIFDTFLIGFIPFWSVVLYNKQRKMSVKKIIFRSLFFFLSLISFCLLAFYIVYVNSFAPSMFSPEFLIYQPFIFYWTVFIASAMLLPPLLSKLFIKN